MTIRSQITQPKTPTKSASVNPLPKSAGSRTDYSGHIVGAATYVVLRGLTACSWLAGSRGGSSVKTALPQ